MSNTDYQNIITEVQNILLEEENMSDWLGRYKSYAEIILANKESIKANRRRLNEWKPLRYYLNVTNAKKAKNTVKFDVRYLGQTVAEMTSNMDGVTITTRPSNSVDYEKSNLRDFDCEIKLKDALWAGEEAASFRAFFKKRKPERNNTADNKGNEEHRIESLLLTEFSKSKEKSLPYIKPITIEGLRFPMPTPLSASKQGTTKYAKQHGGGIDIFARTGTGGTNSTFLCVIELKDENVPVEPASHAIEQAIKYASFIRELLRSEAGANWWRLLGFRGSMSKNLRIHAICAMPNIDNADTSFGGQRLQIGQDEIQLDYIYFTDNADAVEVVKTSLVYGTQTEVVK